jgi:hypothetical protein
LRPQIDKKFDQELVLRFVAFKNWLENYRHEIGAFLTEYMEAVADPQRGVVFDYPNERAVFQKTFMLLQAWLHDDAFYMVVRRRTGTQSKYPFSVLHYEAFTLGIQPHIDRLDPADEPQVQKMQRVSQEIKTDDEFIRLTTGGGKNTKGSLAARVQFVAERIGRNL